MKDEKVMELLEREAIEHCQSLLYLGVEIDSDIKMIHHVDRLSKKIAQAINALRFLKWHLPTNSLLQFFHAHIQSHIHFCAFILLHARAIDIERIQRLQNKSLKIIYDLPDLFPTLDLFKQTATNILPVNGIIYSSAIIMAKKSLLSKDNFLPPVQKMRSQRTLDLKLAPAKKKTLKDDITHTGVKLYNQLPIALKQESNLDTFKSELKQFILSRSDSVLKHGQFTSRNFNI